MTNLAADTGDWRQRSGSTSSSGTGPSGAISGTGYIYLEASEETVAT